MNKKLLSILTVVIFVAVFSSVLSISAKDDEVSPPWERIWNVFITGGEVTIDPDIPIPVTGTVMLQEGTTVGLEENTEVIVSGEVSLSEGTEIGLVEGTQVAVSGQVSLAPGSQVSIDGPVTISSGTEVRTKLATEVFGVFSKETVEPGAPKKVRISLDGYKTIRIFIRMTDGGHEVVGYYRILDPIAGTGYNEFMFLHRVNALLTFEVKSPIIELQLRNLGEVVTTETTVIVYAQSN